MVEPADSYGTPEKRSLASVRLVCGFNTGLYDPNGVADDGRLGTLDVAVSNGMEYSVLFFTTTLHQKHSDTPPYRPQRPQLSRPATGIARHDDSTTPRNCDEHGRRSHDSCHCATGHHAPKNTSRTIIRQERSCGRTCGRERWASRVQTRPPVTCLQTTRARNASVTSAAGLVLPPRVHKHQHRD